MATIVNIFGKLYTFMRRGQPVPTTTDENETRTDNVVADGASSTDDVEECQEAYHSDDKEFVVVNKGLEKLEKCMTDSTASSDWEHIPDVTRHAGKAKDGTGQCLDIPEILLNGSTLSGTDLDAVYLSKSKDDQSKDNELQDEITIEVEKGKSDTGVLTESKQITNPDKEDSKGQIITPDEEDSKGQITQSDKNSIGQITKLDREDGKEKKVNESKRGKDRKMCKFIKRGQRCYKGPNCKFAHSKEHGQQVVAEPGKSLDEKDFHCYIDFVHKSTEQGIQISSKDLFYKLGYEKGVDVEKVGEAVLGQYQLAKGRNNWSWVTEARYFAELFFAPDWIDRNIPHRDVKSNRKNRPSKKNKHNYNEHFENPSGLCRDYRLKENPDIQLVSANAAGDSNSNVSPGQSLSSHVDNHGDEGHSSTGKPSNVDDFVTDYTDEIIQQAMKMALGDGLSESAIMEVIEEVTSVDQISTPFKRNKQTKLDVNRTPRRRPDQLALGFNYHSDLVVQQSPKTVRGEIIPLDTLQKPRERPEQLAVSFNYLAEQLVKDSPKTETGEVIIEGVVTTPRRLARDQLAVGFNYHSDQIAKLSSPKEENMDSNEELDIDYINQKNDTLTLMNGDIKGHDEVKSAKRSISDTIAVGFSYNSDQILKESLDKINGNLPNDNVVSSLIEDVVIGEGRNIVEVVDDIPVVGLPAGSVW
ncbi:uncharacterized protein LOC132726209 isoform X2 [Ruditapes philippinarum]|uniref:uncharacterized protein LOC132726209 isoform X2 n=1 Tax=Ruditapes philippinarum TaxID=129788 RepID=UPI00295A8DA8|nr:uncharacterized protein LOC132726209 isoform X2 [Ruditapes philippinarum]